MPPIRPMHRRAAMAVLSRLNRMSTARLLLVGYVSYMALGFVLLSLPFVQSGVVAPLDNLFIATSAVSTTGLVTVDPGASYNRAGEIVILALFQVGGLGYMTFSSFFVLALRRRLSRGRERTVRASFELPDDISVAAFLRAVVVFTLLVETAGAVALYLLFAEAGREDALWSAIFHAVSAFCTAGFSLNSNSLEAYAGNVGVNAVIAVLSLMGAIGFIVVSDCWRALSGQERRLGTTSRTILFVTLAIISAAFLVILVTDEGIADLPLGERALAAFFQAMSASTTVGFDTVPIGTLGMGSVVVLMLLMIIGASPAGTGGGLKTTTFAVLWGIVTAVLGRRDEVYVMGHEVPLRTVRSAAAAMVFYCGLLLIGMLVLAHSDPGQRFEALVFEAISAMGTVGLSLGITADLSEVGKVVIIVLMAAGRVGILTFGLALAVPNTQSTRARRRRPADLPPA
ncbi:TrkH family potassium uptake protein [Acuticoccus sp. I52.16.1]|uniref:TrkH family potassium uptake protein n=1 Tax=Acuticoccus sp. I52.16.1 TaxID=2928472 RepID=UPI001FD07698|nr:potassium transporter TrkG [Acuticoccus sp. I52.16.1]UOM35288.1 potassium transporter KtrB [Acuticoccus sp. I52.16.1]